MKHKLEGQTFGSWTVLCESKKRKYHYDCVCECGTIRAIEPYTLLKGKSKSCGCKRSELMSKALIKHGMIGTQVYHAWSTMRQRCNNPNNCNYPHYGARGISVCEEWNDFKTFYTDIGDPPTDGHSLDRKENDGDYNKDNCKWSTYQEQQSNTTRSNKITFDGETLTTAEWSRRLGGNRCLVNCRLRDGWNPQEAVSTPVLSNAGNFHKDLHDRIEAHKGSST